MMLVINHLRIRPAWLIPIPSELQTVVNEPIYNCNSYFISYLTETAVYLRELDAMIFNSGVYLF